MSQGNQLVRQWRLISSLEAQPERTTAELARGLQCSERTIRRDLQDLETIGFPFRSQREKERAQLSLRGGHRTQFPLPLTYSEIISLYLASSLLGPLKGTPLQDSLVSLRARVQSILPETLFRFLQDLEVTLSSHPVPSKDYSTCGPLIDQITQAILNRQTLEVDYRSFSRGRVVSRKIDPYRLWYQEGKLCLIAYCHLRQKVLFFVLERIQAIHLTGQTYLIPEGFNLDQYVKDSFGLMGGEPVQVQILFSPRQAPWVAGRLWHPSQKMQYQLDGSLLMSLELADTLELKRWILGFGQEAEVLEPKGLRQAIHQEVARLLDRYAAVPRHRTRSPRRGAGVLPTERLRIEIL